VSEAKRKDDYQKALALYNQGIKDFRKIDYDQALASFRELVETYPEEHELVDRAKVYISICERGPKKSLSLPAISRIIFFMPR